MIYRMMLSNVLSFFTYASPVKYHGYVIAFLICERAPTAAMHQPLSAAAAATGEGSKFLQPQPKPSRGILFFCIYAAAAVDKAGEGQGKGKKKEGKRR